MTTHASSQMHKHIREPSQFSSWPRPSRKRNRLRCDPETQRFQCVGWWVPSSLTFVSLVFSQIDDLLFATMTSPKVRQDRHPHPRNVGLHQLVLRTLQLPFSNASHQRRRRQVCLTKFISLFCRLLFCRLIFVNSAEFLIASF